MLLLTTAILVTSTSATHYIGGKSLVNANFPLQHHYYPHLICIALVVDQIWGFLSDGPVKQAIVVPATPLTHHLQWVTVRPASESDDNGNDDEDCDDDNEMDDDDDDKASPLTDHLLQVRLLVTLKVVKTK